MSYVDEVIELVIAKNPAQPEFHQAVKEVLESLRVVIEANEEEYRKDALLERLVTPERIIMFRVPWVDDKGQVIDGDAILYLCGCYLKDKGELNNNSVVTTIMSNMGLYKAFDKVGISYEKTSVGDKYVNANMMQFGHSLGGEQSGHIIFSRYAATGDGILTSLMVMEACVEKKATLCDLAREMKVYPQLLRNVRVADKKTARENPKVVAAVEEVAKKLGSDGRILVRESGTEPLIRVMVEAGTDELCLENVDHVVKVMESEGLLID